MAVNANFHIHRLVHKHLLGHPDMSTAESPLLFLLERLTAVVFFPRTWPRIHSSIFLSSQFCLLSSLATGHLMHYCRLKADATPFLGWWFQRQCLCMNSLFKQEKKSKQLEKQKCKVLMQKSVMDIWTTLVQLRKCNTSHACKWKESIALCVFRGSKVPLSALHFRLGSSSQSWGPGAGPCLPCAASQLQAPAACIARCFQRSSIWDFLASMQSGSYWLWCCSGDAVKGKSWHWESQKSLLSVKAWFLSLTISFFTAHIKLSGILR